jgi:hypothetical protein
VNDIVMTIDATIEMGPSGGGNTMVIDAISNPVTTHLQHEADSSMARQDIIAHGTS